MIRTIRNAVFGDNGLTTPCGGPEAFYEKRLIFENNYGSHFSPRYLTTFLDRIRNNVLNPSWVTDAIGFNHTNNDPECWNNLIKAKQNYKSMALSDLVKNMTSIFELQKTNVKMAFQGYGKYELHERVYQKFHRDSYVWTTKSDEDKEKILGDFFKGQPPKAKKIISAEGLPVPNIPKTKGKPGKARKQGKTTTFPKNTRGFTNPNNRPDPSQSQTQEEASQANEEVTEDVADVFDSEQEQTQRNGEGSDLHPDDPSKNSQQNEKRKASKKRSKLGDAIAESLSHLHEKAKKGAKKAQKYFTPKRTHFMPGRESRTRNINTPLRYKDTPESKRKRMDLNMDQDDDDNVYM